MQVASIRLRRTGAAPSTGRRPPPGGIARDRPWPEVTLPRHLRAARRIALVVLWTVLAVPVQAVLARLPGHGKAGFARFYWHTVCRLFGLRVRVIGTPARPSDGRGVVFVANHTSWLDIPALGGAVDACFVSKAEVGRWPAVGTVARLGRTIFVSRRAADTARERDAMRARLAAGDSLILFPEGTSSDGSRVMPFRSSFFSVAEGERPPLIQPVSLVYDRLGFLPVGRATRPVFAWFGAMDLAPHAWRLAQACGMRATILLHAPLDPAAFASRKALAQATWTVVADGAALLRQNRPVTAPAAMRRPASVPGMAEAGGAAEGAPGAASA